MGIPAMRPAHEAGLRLHRRVFLHTTALMAALVTLSVGAKAASARHDRLRVPLAFEQNTGRYDSQVRFSARIGGATVFITPTEAVMALPVAAAAEPSADEKTIGRRLRGPATRLRPRPAFHVVRMQMVGSNRRAVPTGGDRLPGFVHYFRGNDPSHWRTRVPTYARVRITGVYPGIDMVYYGHEAGGQRHQGRGPAMVSPSPWSLPAGGGGGNGSLTHAGGSSQLSALTSQLSAVTSQLSALTSQLSALEYDFVVAAGADPSRIRLAIQGADRIRVADGALILSTPAGDVRLRRPYAYQTIGGRRVQVACSYQLRRSADPHEGTGVGLRLARYDTSRPLIVDPIVEFATYLGGADDDGSKSVAMDAAGSVYVTGHSYGADFPTTSGAYDTTANGDLDAFILKLTPGGDALVYGTYIGGSDWDHCHAIAVDAAGSAYIGGETISADFPTTVGAYQTARNGDEGDAFVARLSPDGSSLVFGTFIGGSAWDCVNSVAVNGAGAVCVGGYTQSADWPTSSGAFSTTYAGGSADGVVALLSNNGASLISSTYLGGSGDDYVMAIVADAAGALTLTGMTSSAGFPTTSGAYATAYAGGGSDAFAARVAADLAGLHFSTFLGGADADAGYGVAVDGSGRAYVGGETRSTDFPTTAGAFQTTLQGSGDGFVVCLTAAGSGMAYGTLLGGNGYDAITGLALHAGDRAAVTGYTFSTDFPVTSDAFDPTLVSGDLDAFVCVLASDGTAQAYSSYIGADGSDTGLAIAASGSSIAVVGNTWSADFPTTAGAFDPTANGNGEGFAIKLSVEARSPTTQYTIDRVGTITEYTFLRQYDLKRVTDNALLEGKTIVFRIDGTTVGTAVTNAGGDSSLLWTITDGPASRTITTEFAGDALHEPSSANAVLTAQTHATKTFGVNRDGKITAYRVFKAWLYRLDNTPVVGKSVSFKLDGTFLGSDVTRTTGLAQIGYTIADGVGAGTRTILAEWAGDGGYLPSSATNTLTVYKATPYLWVMPRTVPRGGVARLYAYFRRLADYAAQAGKTVTFRVDGTFIADVVTTAEGAPGIARYDYTTVEPPGDHVIRCEFAGDAWVDAGFGEAILRVY